MEEEGTNVSCDPRERRTWNLTHPNVFKRDYIYTSRRESQRCDASDTLIQQPPRLWDDVMKAMEKYPTLWEALLRIIG